MPNNNTRKQIMTRRQLEEIITMSAHGGKTVNCSSAKVNSHLPPDVM